MENNNMAQQSSVEWLVDKVFGENGLILYAEVIEQAKEKHKEETMDAFNYGMNCSADYFEAWSKTTEAENYYNQTFKQQ